MEEIKAGELLHQLYCIATADATKLMKVRGGALEVADTEGLEDSLKLAIAGIEKTGGGIKVKLYDKLKALELLGKYMGLFDGTAAQKKTESPLLRVLVQNLEKESERGEIQSETADGDDLVGAAAV